MMVQVRVLHVLSRLPFIVIGGLSAFTLGSKWGSGQELAIDLALCAAVAGLMVVFRLLDPPWASRPAGIAVFMTGMVVLTFVLVLRESWFGLLVIACFIYAYSIVVWPWQLLAVGSVAVVAGIAQGSGTDTSSARGVLAYTAVILFNIVVMCGLSWILRLTHREFERSGVEAERNRLAHEIHDTLAQCLAGIVTQLQAAENAPDQEIQEQHTSTALLLARDGLREARQSMQALRPPALEEARLPAAIENVSRAWSERTGVTVTHRTLGTVRPVSTDTEVALLRAVQECLANADHHAEAGRVKLTVRYSATALRVEVHDDGRGFDPARLREPDIREGGYGLTAMRERLEALSGTLVVDSRPGHGTTVRAEVPA